MEAKELDEIVEHSNFFADVSSVTKCRDNNLVISTSNLAQVTGLDKDKKFVYNFHIGDEVYRVHLIDERLLFSSLFAWRDLSYTSLFQSDNETVVDNTHGRFELAKKENYLSTIKVGEALLGKKVYYVGELYDTINRMIDYKEQFKLFHKKGEPKLSEDFFKKVYEPLISSAQNKYNKEDGSLIISSYPLDIQEELKSAEIRHPEKVLKKYYRKK